MAAMRKAFKYLDCTDEQKVRFATFMLTNDAERWWETQERIFVDQRREITWQRFEKIFYEQFFPITVRESKSREFLELKQDKLTVAEYERKFIALQRFAPESALGEDFRTQKFISGLSGGIREKVLYDECKNFAKAVKKALIAESVLEETMKEIEKRNGQKSIGEPPTKKQKFQQQYNSRSTQFKQYHQQQQGQQLQGMHQRCDKCKVYHKGNCPIRLGACIKYGKMGYLAKDCRIGVVCYFCGQAVHSYRRCPSVGTGGKQQQQQPQQQPQQQSQGQRGKPSGKPINQQHQGVTPQA